MSVASSVQQQFLLAMELEPGSGHGRRRSTFGFQNAACYLRRAASWHNPLSLRKGWHSFQKSLQKGKQLCASVTQYRRYTALFSSQSCSHSTTYTACNNAGTALKGEQRRAALCESPIEPWLARLRSHLACLGFSALASAKMTVSVMLVFLLRLQV